MSSNTRVVLIMVLWGEHRVQGIFVDALNMFIYIRLYVHTYTYVYTYVHTYVYTYVYTYTYTWVYVLQKKGKEIHNKYVNIFLFKNSFAITNYIFLIHFVTRYS